MTEPLAEVRTLPVSRTTSAGRVRRLHRGVDRWVQAMRYDRVCRRRVWLLLLTTESADVEVVAGHIRRFWAAVHDKYGPQAYFTWLEVQQRGAAHYHGMWVDPPCADTAATKRWLEATWGLGFVKVRQRSVSWFSERAADYVKAEAKANLKKGYQQDYSAIPTHIRTFQCQRLAFAGADLDRHRDRQLVDYVPPRPMPSADGHLLPAHELEHLVLWATVRHVEFAAGGCELWRFRRNLRKTKALPQRSRKGAPSKGVTRVSPTRGLRGAARAALRSV